MAIRMIVVSNAVHYLAAQETVCPSPDREETFPLKIPHGQVDPRDLKLPNAARSRLDRPVGKADRTGLGCAERGRVTQ